MNCPAGYIPLKKACWKITSSAATQANAEAACQADRTGQFTSGKYFNERTRKNSNDQNFRGKIIVSIRIFGHSNDAHFQHRWHR